MSRAILVAVALSAALHVSLGHAAPQELQKMLNAMAHEMAECAAYFSIVSVAMENSSKPDSAQQWRERSDKAIERAAMITKEAGLKLETVAARYKKGGFRARLRQTIAAIDGGT